jgi:hypothetical protein
MIEIRYTNKDNLSWKTERLSHNSKNKIIHSKDVVNR